MLLLSRRQAFTSPQAADNIVVLSSSTPVVPHGSLAATIGSSCTKVWFASTAARDAFLVAAKAAVADSAGGIERYNVQYELGHGASGTVYLVQRKTDGAMFAMKAVSKADAFFSDSRLANLVAERIALAEAASRQSAFIVRLVDAFETASHLCFVTELGHFGDLSDVLRQMRKGKLEEQVAKKLFAEIVLALEESHRMGYLYRDMKLANLVLNKFGHIRLADFGLAKKLDAQYEGSSVTSVSDSGSDVTSSEDEDEPFRLVGRTKSFVGTRRYMSPEHLKGGQTKERGYGAPADVWAMGVTLYIMMTGEYPFGRDVSSRNSAAMFTAIQTEDIVYPSWLSEEAVSMLKGLLNRESLDRFDINDIKGHAWMGSIDWEQLKLDSTTDVPQVDVLSVLQESEVKLVGDAVGESEKVIPNADLFSSLSGSSSDGSKKRKKGVLDGYELLGFGYVSSEDSFYSVDTQL